MTFNYQPLTEEQCEKARQFPLLEPGVYDFQVLTSEEKKSQSGNDMISLKLKIRDKNGNEFNVFDYLVSSENMLWKTKHFCDSVELFTDYQDGTFNGYKCFHKTGKALIGIQKGKDKGDGTFYKDKNVVEDYVTSDSGIEQINNKNFNVPVSNFKDDDLPF